MKSPRLIPFRSLATERRAPRAGGEIYERRAAGSLVRRIAFILIGGVSLLFFLNALRIANEGEKLKTELKEGAKSGLEKIVGGITSIEHSDFTRAQESFTDAQNTFRELKKQAWFTVSNSPTKKPLNSLFAAANALTNGGESLSAAGILFTQSARVFAEIPALIFEKNLVAGDAKDRPSLTEKLKAELPRVTEGVEFLAAATNDMSAIPENLVPTSAREQFVFGKRALAGVTKLFGSAEKNIPALLTLLGDSEPHTFLVLLQNNAELRPTGGFIGNYMLVETNDGYITKMEVHDVYSADHQLAEVIAPPPEIAAITPRWFLHDSNYSADFPLSAQSAATFLEKTGGPGVDTVVAIDQSLLTDILKLTGPISIASLSAPLTAENVSSVLSYIVEAKVFGKEDPKAIVRELLPAVQKTLFTKVKPHDLVPVFTSAIAEKHLQLYSKDPSVEEFFERVGAAGKMIASAPNEDFFAVVHTSIGGNKSDQFMNEEILHTTFLQQDASVIDEVTITRTHTWDSGTEARLRNLVSSFGFPTISRKVIEILGRSRNVQMLRIYVPDGSELIAHEGAPVTLLRDGELGKSYFSVRMEVGVADRRIVKIRYKLPFQVPHTTIASYVLQIQKQAGQDNVTLVKKVVPSADLLFFKGFPESGSFDPDRVWTLKEPLETDRKIQTVWGR